MMNSVMVSVMYFVLSLMVLFFFVFFIKVLFWQEIQVEVVLCMLNFNDFLWVVSYEHSKVWV